MPPAADWRPPGRMNSSLEYRSPEEGIRPENVESRRLAALDREQDPYRSYVGRDNGKFFSPSAVILAPGSAQNDVSLRYGPTSVLTCLPCISAFSLSDSESEAGGSSCAFRPEMSTCRSKTRFLGSWE